MELDNGKSDLCGHLPTFIDGSKSIDGVKIDSSNTIFGTSKWRLTRFDAFHFAFLENGDFAFTVQNGSGFIFAAFKGSDRMGK